jgi:cyclopropane-fatty-acyl-phospholipid synthase
MTTSTAHSFALPVAAPAAARAVFHLLSRLQTGTLDLQLPDGSQARFGNGQAPRAALRLNDWRMCSAVLKAGDVGFAESWIEGAWSSPDLVALLTLFIANREAVESAIYGSWWGSLAHRVRHCSTAIRAAAAARTSTPTTTSATPSIANGWTRP